MTVGDVEATPPESRNAARSIVCFSHLGWDAGLFQRPQQIMSRLASMGREVYYFACVGHRRHREKPMAGPVPEAPGVYVYTIPYAPGVTRMAGIRRWAAGLQIAGILARARVRNPLLWFYHPSLFALGYSHADSAIVYDVMDHFPSFESSVDDAYFDELTLLAEADVIFTGGRSLDRHARAMVDALIAETASPPEWHKRFGKHVKRPVSRGTTGTPANSYNRLAPVHCLPSGVDLQHFAKAYSAASATDVAGNSNAIQQLPQPRFGYFGAIDERIDWNIITALAEATDGSVILAGPHLREPPQGLPANVHLPGSVEYARLPQLLSLFDVCLIPFINTPLVQFISPTKTPEYLAGGRSVVSTPIPDVVADYGDVVRIAATTGAFVDACLELAAEPTDADALAQEAARRARTWDQIAAEMERIVTLTLAGGERP